MLHKHLKAKDHKEHWVVEKSCENIDFLSINYSAIDLVEHVHQDESVEHDCVKD